MKNYPPLSAVTTGLACKCPRCGQGELFSGFLNLHKTCSTCELDYEKADSADGPAVFMIFIVGFFAVLVVFISRFTFDAPAWLSLTLGFITTAGLILVLMRPLKAMMIALQYRHKASEGSLAEDTNEWT